MVAYGGRQRAGCLVPALPPCPGGGHRRSSAGRPTAPAASPSQVAGRLPLAFCLLRVWLWLFVVQGKWMQGPRGPYTALTSINFWSRRHEYHKGKWPCHTTSLESLATDGAPTAVGSTLNHAGQGPSGLMCAHWAPCSAPMAPHTTQFVGVEGGGCIVQVIVCGSVG